jgi:hypothetical protein
MITTESMHGVPIETFDFTKCKIHLFIPLVDDHDLMLQLGYFVVSKTSFTAVQVPLDIRQTPHLASQDEPTVLPMSEATDLHGVVSSSVSTVLTFEDWYAATPSRSVVKLQVIAEAMSDFAAGGSDQLLDQKVESFYFTALVGAYDAVRKTAPMLSDWELSSALFSCRLVGADDAAFGGDLAYQYGRHGRLTGIGLAAAHEIVSDSGFGTQAQTLRPLSALQSGALMLS